MRQNRAFWYTAADVRELNVNHLDSPQPSTGDTAKDLGPDAIRLIRMAASTDGTMIAQGMGEGYVVSAGRKEFTERNARSAAKWRDIIKDLVAPSEIELRIDGPADAQYLEIKSNRVLQLRQLDCLMSSGASVAIQKLSEEGREIKVKLVPDRIVTFINTPRSDWKPYDHAGPAKLRLRFDHPDEIVLPLMLQPKMVQNTQWITLIGSQNFQLPV